MNSVIKECLEATGLPWRVVPGRGHRKIELNGRLVGVVPASSKDGSRRATLNVRAQIRRAAQEMKNAN